MRTCHRHPSIIAHLRKAAQCRWLLAYIIEHRQTKTLPRFQNPAKTTTPTARSGDFVVSFGIKSIQMPRDRVSKNPIQAGQKGPDARRARDRAFGFTQNKLGEGVSTDALRRDVLTFYVS